MAPKVGNQQYNTCVDSPILLEEAILESKTMPNIFETDT